MVRPTTDNLVVTTLSFIVRQLTLSLPSTSREKCESDLMKEVMAGSK